MRGPTAATLAGPVLTEAKYPDVPVARAFSRGDDLELVLHPGGEPGVQQIGIGQLRPGKNYVATGVEEKHFTANDEGIAKLNVALSGRVEVAIRPL